MKITAINIPDEKTKPFGLRPIQMSRLENVVVLAGKNGAGKTRVFKLLREFLSKYPNNALEAKTKEAIKTYIGAIDSHNRTIQSLQNDGETVRFENEANTWQKQLQ